jgi:CheY-like chemotaxis protein
LPVLVSNSSPLVGGGPDRFIVDDDSFGSGLRSASPARPRLLLADDEAMVRRAVLRGLSRLLNLTEQDVTAADGFEAACRVFDLVADHLQAVVTDMNMPHYGDGLRLYRHVRIAKPFLPIVFMSGGMRDEEERALQGILTSDARSRFFDKPVETRVLSDWIRSHW